MSATFDDTVPAVGPRLKRLRTRTAMTLQQVADQTGISISTLSRLEAGQRRPTLELLLPLARVYRVSLDDLVGAPATGDPRISPRPVVRRGGATWMQLAKNPGGANAFKQVLPVETPTTRPRELCSHEGYEWAYVLNGQLRLTLGDTDYLLNPGEAAEFDTNTQHGYANAGKIPLELLVIFGGQGDRVHLRVRASR
ncbi:MAG: XRE family transcriptional regulator [Propionibacteriales bacterium]|nr:XRE family transcriptional regulator [Propionibacteriales bacterium]